MSAAEEATDPLDPGSSLDLAASVEMRSLLFEYVDDLLLITTADGSVVDVNHETGALFGVDDPCMLLGTPVTSVLNGSAGIEALSKCLDRQHDFADKFVAEITRVDGTTAFLDTKAIWSASAERIFFLARDVSEEMRKASDMAVQLAALTQLAFTDVLTGLANRLVYQGWIDARREGDIGGWLVLIDVDDFKKINDVFGHPGGDLFLSEFGRRLQKAVRSNDAVARIGGDEFAMLLPAAMNENAVRGRLRYLTSRLASPYFIQDRPVRVRFSAGASYCPAWWTNEQWVASADSALYEAKENKREFCLSPRVPATEPIETEEELTASGMPSNLRRYVGFGRTREQTPEKSGI